ncbi:hypothetical protein BC629DRAFT_51111 [Irpex lacteus]|nr:hypothetical protein BC629DRAFT_51111 [Irpex lacteus]
MSAYAPYPISGFLPQPYISTIAHTTTGFSPSVSASSVDTARYYTLGKRQRLPEIVVEDTSLDATFHDSPAHPNSLLKTPSKRLDVRKSAPSGSPVMSWLDEQTLTNTPCTALSKEKAFFSTPKRDLRSSKLSTTILTPPHVTVPLPVFSNDKSVVEDCLDNTLEQDSCIEIELTEDLPLEEATTPSSPRRVPKLRRSNGNDDLRTMYHHTASPLPSSDAGVQELSFDEQLTLAILAEMDRAPNRFLAHRREPVAKSSSTSLLSTLGNLLRIARSPVSRVW